MSFRVLITGSRDWADDNTIYNAIAEAAADGGAPGRSIIVIHGGARGADRIAGEAARAFGMGEEVHRADWTTYGKAAGHRRNAEMVALGADLCLAFPIGESRGTRGCIRLAERADIPVRVHEGATR